MDGFIKLMEWWMKCAEKGKINHQWSASEHMDEQTDGWKDGWMTFWIDANSEISADKLNINKQAASVFVCQRWTCRRRQRIFCLFDSFVFGLNEFILKMSAAVWFHFITSRLFSACFCSRHVCLFLLFVRLFCFYAFHANHTPNTTSVILGRSVGICFTLSVRDLSS